MSLGSGELTRKITIERFNGAGNGQGGEAQTWAALRTTWAKATPIAGKETLLNGTLRTSQAWRIEMRFCDVTVKDRLRMPSLIGNQVLGIQSVADPDNRRRSLVLFCETESGVV